MSENNVLDYIDTKLIEIAELFTKRNCFMGINTLDTKTWH